MTSSDKQDIRLMNKVSERLKMYGVEIKRGRCKGFCHNGHDYNMVVKDYSCFCYVCRKSFDIFDVVQHFENCSFAEALDKLGRPRDYATQRDINKVKAKMKLEEIARQKKEQKYWDLWSKWILIDTIIMYADPNSQLYADAIHKREYLNYRMEAEL